MSNALSNFEQRGYLTTWDSTLLNTRRMAGWFMLSNDGRIVNARRIGGRNRWGYSTVENVVEFTLDQNAK